MTKRFLLNLLLVGTMAATMLGCSQTPEQQTYSVDKYSLMRSAVYNQRELINSQLQNLPKPTSVREQLLLSNYCDLIDRRIIYSKQKPQQCPPEDQQHDSCTAAFHRCIQRCQLRSDECNLCEAPALRCIESSKSGPVD